MAYQPVHAIGTNNGNEVEALIRWRHPQLGELAPEAFVQVAEQSNLIVALGQKVFGMVLQQLKKWVSVRARGVISGVGDGVFWGGACPTPKRGGSGGHRAHRYGGVCTLQP
jgi:hypothetical protein